MPVEVEVAKAADPAFGPKRRWDSNAAPAPEQGAKPDDTGVAPATVKAAVKPRKPVTTVEDGPTVVGDAKPESVKVTVTSEVTRDAKPPLSEKTLAEIAEGKRVLAQYRR